MQYFLEHFGVSVAAITGALAARGKQVDLFGVLVLALVTAFGGGTVRDVLLGDLPVFWTADQSFILNASLTAVVTFYLVRYHALPVSVLMVADAFALALFTMIGTRKGVAFSVAPAIAVIMGVTTGVAGGIFATCSSAKFRWCSGGKFIFTRRRRLAARHALCCCTNTASPRT